MLENMKLLKAVAKLDSEYVNIELGNEAFLSVTSISQIAKFFSVNLKEIDIQFQELKDIKYRYDEACEIDDESELLYEVFEYSEIQNFAEMIIEKVAESLQIRINSIK